jgi:hypothetical protein
MFMRRHRRLVDEAFERYAEWREQLSTCDFAYREWAGAAGSRDSEIAFARYAAALDREEQAAAQYEIAFAAASGSAKADRD